MPDAIELATRLWLADKGVQALHAVIDVLETRGLIERVRIKEALDQRNIGNYARAEEILSRAIREAGGLTLIGELYHHLGTNAQGAGNFEEALRYLRMAFQIRNDAGDILGLAYTAFQIPMCKELSGVPRETLIPDFQKARNAIYAALEIFPDLSVEHQGNMRQNLAFCLQVEQKFEQALEEYKKVLEFRENAEGDKPENERRGTAMTRARIAECLLELGLFKETKEQAQKALLVFEHLEDVNRIKQVQTTLRRLEEKATIQGQ